MLFQFELLFAWEVAQISIGWFLQNPGTGNDTHQTYYDTMNESNSYDLNWYYYHHY